MFSIFKHTLLPCIIFILHYIVVSQVFSFFSFSIYNVSFLCCLFVKLGTGLSILISKSNPSLVTSFAFLSCGYLLSSYHEVCFNSLSLLLWKIFLINFHVTKLMSFYYQVRSVVLNTLNRARFTVAVDSFIKTGMSTLSFESSYQISIHILWKERCYCILLLYLLRQHRKLLSLVESCSKYTSYICVKELE